MTDERIEIAGDWALPIEGPFLVGDRIVYSYENRDVGYIGRGETPPEGWERIRFDDYLERIRHQYAEARPELLPAFGRLGNARPATILAFARRWGVLGGALGICEHGPDCQEDECGPREDDAGRPWESIDDWRRLARAARAVVRAAEVLREPDWISPGVPGGELPNSVWLDLYGGPDGAAIRRVVEMRSDVGAKARLFDALLDAVNAWVRAADLRPRLYPRFSWERGLDVGFDLGVQDLFGAIAMALLAAVSGRSGLLACSGCGRLYEPDPERRRPAAGRGHYCAACRGADVPARLASARWKKRRREVASAGA